MIVAPRIADLYKSTYVALTNCLLTDSTFIVFYGKFTLDDKDIVMGEIRKYGYEIDRCDVVSVPAYENENRMEVVIKEAN